MGAFMKNLTTVVPFGKAYQCGFVPVGVTRALTRRTVLNVFADCVDGVYTPAITIFSYGKKVEPMADSHCFRLGRERLLVCVRGMRLDNNGRPQGFLVEQYTLPAKPELKIIK